MVRLPSWRRRKKSILAHPERRGLGKLARRECLRSSLQAYVEPEYNSPFTSGTSVLHHQETEAKQTLVWLIVDPNENLASHKISASAPVGPSAPATCSPGYEGIVPAQTFSGRLLQSIRCQTSAKFPVYVHSRRVRCEVRQTWERGHIVVCCSSG